MKPKYISTPAIVRDLMEIEATLKVVDMTVLPLHFAE